MPSPEMKQIFLSYCVGSNKQKASQLQEILEEKGFTVFNCVKLESGDNFREKIFSNICRCRVLIIFLDKAWSESRECNDEYLVAKGHYNRNKQEEHTIIPIIIDGLKNITEEHILAYSIVFQNQCLEVPPNADESDWDEVFQKVVERCEKLIGKMSIQSNKMSSLQRKQIFLSYCVGSTKERASQLQEMLEEKSFTVFNCVKLESRDHFREKILTNNCRCQVLIIFLDKAWSESEECRKEYLVAKDHYNRNKEKEHTIIPITIGGLGWLRELLAYSIFLQWWGYLVPQNADESDWDEVCEEM